MTDRRYLRIALLVPAIIILYYVFQIFRPFLVSVILAAILVSLAYPAFEWTCRRLKGRRGWAALITCLWLTLLIIVPFVVILVLLAQQVAHVYTSFQAEAENGHVAALLAPDPGGWIGSIRLWLSEQLGLEDLDVMANVGAALQQASVLLLRYATDILSGVFSVFMNFFIILITMFFLFRDGERLSAEIRGWSPLSLRYEQRLVQTFRQVASAAVVGNLLTALAQGTASGIVFWSLGVSNAIFWGALSAFGSLIPVVGASIVWVPWAIYFFATGMYLQGVLMVALQSLIVGSIDNVLRPILIEGKARMHTLVVFLSIIGGIAYFGILGMFLGPIIVALGLTFLELYKTEFREELMKIPHEE
jgi:predicted PurR-regulated permease PerM